MAELDYSELLKWAHTERQFLKQDVKWLQATAQVLSPSGENVTSKRLPELEHRLWTIETILDGIERQQRLSGA